MSMADRVSIRAKLTAETQDGRAKQIASFIRDAVAELNERIVIGLEQGVDVQMAVDKSLYLNARPVEQITVRLLREM